MVESGRYAIFTIPIKDKPGELQKVLSSLTELDANIQTVNHQRMGKHIYPGDAQLEISVETKNHDHIQQLYQALTKKNYHVEMSHY
jgi:threonine dehydratase